MAGQGESNMNPQPFQKLGNNDGIIYPDLQSQVRSSSCPVYRCLHILWDINSLSASKVTCQCCLLITFVNKLDPDQARHNVGLDLDPNCLTL